MVFRGCGDSDKQHPLPTGPSSPELLPCRAADSKFKQVFSTSHFKVHVPDGRAGTPMLGHLRGRTERAAAPAGDARGVSSRTTGGRSGQEKRKHWCTLLPGLE